MTHLRCQQASCSALTASHRDSAQSACLSVRPSVRHTPVLCHYHPHCSQSACLSVRLSVRPSHYPSIARQPHRDSVQSVHPSVCLFVTLPFHRSPTWSHPAAHCRQPPRQILSKFPKNSPKTQIRLDSTLNFDETGSIENDGR